MSSTRHFDSSVPQSYHWRSLPLYFEPVSLLAFFFRPLPFWPHPRCDAFPPLISPALAGAALLPVLPSLPRLAGAFAPPLFWSLLLSASLPLVAAVLPL